MPGGRHARSGLSGSSWIFRRPPSPLTPGSPSAARAHCFTDGVWFRLLRQVDHYHWFNEAETGSLALRLTSSPSLAPTARLPASPPSQLHGERAIAMVSTFQLTRSTRLSLTDRRKRRGKSRAEFRGWTNQGKVRMVSTIADATRGQGRLLKQAETSPEFFVSFVTFCSK